MENKDKYIDHMCKITIDPKGNHIESGGYQSYTLMNSDKHIFPESKEYWGMKYLGFGECYSAYDTETHTKIMLLGEGHFWIKL